MVAWRFKVLTLNQKVYGSNPAVSQFLSLVILEKQVNAFLPNIKELLDYGATFDYIIILIC